MCLSRSASLPHASQFICPIQLKDKKKKIIAVRGSGFVVLGTVPAIILEAGKKCGCVSIQNSKYRLTQKVDVLLSPPEELFKRAENLFLLSQYTDSDFM